jgi:hypothetical protein
VRVKLDRDDTRAEVHEWTDERAGTGADIENEIAGCDSCREDKAASPVVSELMPSPVRPPFGGHDAPSPSSMARMAVVAGARQRITVVAARDVRRIAR